MSESREEQLQEVVRSGDVVSCVDFFKGMPEKERKKLAPLAVRLLGERESGPYIQCQRVAVLATASLGQVKRFGADIISSSRWYDIDAEIETLHDRRPDWLRNWCEWFLDRFLWQWSPVRRLIRERLCEPPGTEMYVLGMIPGVRDNESEHEVLSGLRKDPELLDSMVWRLFDIQGNSNASLAYIGDITGEEKGWSYALRELSKEGLLDRQRLLDESLAALNRDFSQYYAGWFSRFHEYMEPTVEERAARADRYLDLLASPIQPTVTMAVKSLQALHKAGQLDGAAFVARAEPVLYAKAKGTVKPVLGILGGIAGKQPALAVEAARLAAVALEHKAPEIQEAALTLIEKHGNSDDAGLMNAVETRLSVMAATTRKDAEAWLGAEETATVAGPELEDQVDIIERARAVPARLAVAGGILGALNEFDSLQGYIPAIERLPQAKSAGLGRIIGAAARSLSSRFIRDPHSGYLHGFSNKWAVSENILRDVLIEALFGSLNPEARKAWAMCDRPAYARDVLMMPRWIDRPRPAYEPQSAFFNQTLDPEAELTPVSMIMLCLNLGAADAEDGQAATDVLIQTTTDGRLDGMKLGGSMRLLLRVGLVKPNKWVSQLVKPNRWADRLGVAATESPLHAQVVRNALIQALPATPAQGMRNVHTLLELLHDLCIEAEEAVTDPGCRAFLEGISGTGKAAKLAKKLLALEAGDPLPHRRAAAVAALRGRLERAERWAGRQPKGSE